MRTLVLRMTPDYRERMQANDAIKTSFQADVGPLVSEEDRTFANYSESR